MAAKDLITLDRAKLIITSITDASQDGLLTALITAASDAIQKYCRRDFVQTAYDELYSGNGQRQLLLRQYPLVSVQSVRYRPVTVLKVTNTDSTNVQAHVSVTSTGITLVRVKNGVKSTDTSVTFAGNVTLSAVATAINALGNGWSANMSATPPITAAGRARTFIGPPISRRSTRAPAARAPCSASPAVSPS